MSRSRPRQENGRGESLVGCSSDARGPPEARRRHRRAHCLPPHAEPAPGALTDLADVPRWRTFPAKHVLGWSPSTFLTVPTARLRVLFVLVILAHHRRRVIHFNVTEHATATWTAKQIVDAFPNDSAPAYLLRDRDRVYGHVFRQRLRGCRGNPDGTSQPMAESLPSRSNVSIASCPPGAATGAEPDASEP